VKKISILHQVPLKRLETNATYSTPWRDRPSHFSKGPPRPVEPSDFLGDWTNYGHVDVVFRETHGFFVYHIFLH